MASWSTRRKSAYFIIFVALIAIFIGVPAFFLFYKEPTCFDGRRNGGERGVDCGGNCVKLCVADFVEPKVLWSHSMRVTGDVYNSLSYVQNPNPSVEAKSLSYVFRLYDDAGLLIIQRTGKTAVPAGQRFAVFEGGIRVGERIPVRTTFEFTETPEWTKGELLTKIKVLNIGVQEGAQPSAEVRIKNVGVIESYSNVDAFIILYDQNDNRVAFSKTVLEKIGPDEETSLYFTWQEAFPRPIVRTEVLLVHKKN